MQKFFKFLTVKTVLIFIFLINLSVVLFCFNNKNGFHSDEQWSYAHANSTKGAYLDKEINSYYQTNDNIKQRLFNQWIDSKTLQNYLTVQEKDKFLYKNIYQNLKVVEHPPLYFILLHTVCSFFPDSFSKWYAASINIIAFILIYMMLFKLSKILLKDDKLALVTTTFWGFSSIGIATIVFLRMYILQTLLSLCLAYEIIKIIEANKANSKQLFLVGLYSLLGMYNQYNSIFFSFFATIVSLFFLYKRKNYKLLFQFGGTMLLSVIMLFIIYPQTYEVLSDSLRAKQVVSNMMQQHHSSEFNIMNIFLYLDIRISKFIELITEYFFVFHHTNYQVIAFLFIISVVLSVYFKIKI
ncbi:MAG: hypothetical protein J6W96_02820, partial [Alphaproteobacteria bacterium]|nr:hypothetical protein [Alphaproteobacteria bacterium]